MAEPILIAQSKEPIFLLPKMANRHGLTAGATGTGKTVTLQTLAENFSAQGVPVFMADVKGDLAGLSQPGANNPKVVERAKDLKIDNFSGEACPVVFWDVFGEQGHPVRATVSEMGPLQQRRYLGHGRAHRVPLFSEHIPEHHRASFAFETVDLKLLRPFDHIRIVSARLAQSREIALYVGHKNRHASRAEILRERLKRHCLSSSRRAGNKAVAIGHFGQEKDRFLRLRNEDGFSHGRASRFWPIAG